MNRAKTRLNWGNSLTILPLTNPVITEMMALHPLPGLAQPR